MTVLRPTAAMPRSATPELRLEHVPVGEWPARARRLRQAHGAVFADLFAGPRIGDDEVALTLLMSLPESTEWLALRDALPVNGAYPSLVGEMPAGAAYEREVFERYALTATGHSHLSGLGYRRPEPGPAGDPLERLPLRPAPPGVVDYPLGPVRSGIVESGHYTIRTVGEEILDVRLQLAYKHRGIEDLACDARLDHLPLLAERISGTDAVAHSLACVQALERLAGREAPSPARAARTLFAELERLHVHVDYLAELCRATGLAVGQAQLEIVREELLRLNARIAGHRYLFGVNVVGGGGPSAEPLDVADVGRTVEAQRRALAELARMLEASSSHMDRLQATGRVDPAVARDLALTGPVGRASGVDADARRDHPYADYADRAVPIPLREQGDAAARMAVRAEEALIAADLVIAACERPPRAHPRDERPADPRPGTVGFGWAEGARGTELHWVETNEDARIVRYRVRSASFCCWQAFARAIPGGNILTDFPVIEQSFGLSYAGSDR